MDTTPTTITNTSTSSAHPLIVDTNSNEMATGDSAYPCSPTNLLLNERIGDLCVSGTDCPANMEHSSGLANPFSQTSFTANGANLLSSEEHLLQVIQIKSARIQELEHLLRCKENEIAELKSHLDKFQSVFPFSSRGRKGGVHGANGQRQRAQGISAEPQSESSVLELLHVTFPKYEKDER